MAISWETKEDFPKKKESSMKRVSMKKIVMYGGIMLAVVSMISLLSPSRMMAEEKKILTIMCMETSPGGVRELRNICSKFEALHPNVRVEPDLVYYGDAYQRMVAAIAAGVPPDVIHEWLALGWQMAMADVLLPVDEVVEEIGASDWNLAGLHPIEGHYYFLPWAVEVYVLWYRTDLFEQKGLQAPLRTREDLLEAAKKLTEDLNGDGTIDRYGIALPMGDTIMTQLGFWAWFWSAGGRTYDNNLDLAINSPEAVDAVRFYLSFKPYAPPECTGFAWYEQIESYYSERVAMSIYAGRMLMNLKQYAPDLLPVTSAMPIPPPRKKPEVVVHHYLSEDGWVVAKDSRHPELAKELAKFLITGDQYLDWLSPLAPHKIPPRKSVYEDPRWWDNELVKTHPEAVQVMLDALQTAWNVGIEGGPESEQDSTIEFSKVVTEMLQSAWIKGTSPENVVAWAEEEFVRLIGRKLEKIE